MSTKKKTTTVKKRAPKAPAAAPAKRAYAPRPYYYRGTGDYYKAPKAIRPSKSTTKSLGGSIGAHLGHGLQTVIKALTGFGDYDVVTNSLMPETLGGDPPIIRNSRDNSHIVHHREYIADVYAANIFTPTVYPLNPGIIGTFPWLQQQADSYEQYRFRGLVMEFKSMSSDAVLSSAASSSLGTVVMSTQYNSYNQPFTDKRTMENYEYANSKKPSESFLHPVECKMSQTSVSELYVRQGAVSQGDLRLYDLGTFTIAVQGMQNTQPNQVIGELWCSYEIEFYKPKLLVGGGALLTDHFQGFSAAGLFTTATPLGVVGTMVPRSGNNLGCTMLIGAIAPYGANSIVFPANVVNGLYMVTYVCSGSVNTATSPSYTAGGTTVNIDVVSTQVRILGATSTSYQLTPGPSSTTASFTVIQILRVIQSFPGTPAGISLLFPGGLFPTGNVTVDVMVTQLAPSVN